MASVFISHSSRDNELAAEIKAWLVGQGYENVFLDFDKATGLDAGREWERQLYEAIGRCHAVLLIVTPAWMESKWCFAEFTQARGLGKVIFPLVVTPDDRKLIGPTLRTIQAELWDQAGQDHLARRLREVAEEIARGHRWDPSRPPWPGILAFEAEDAAVFFGRDPEIRKISELLEARRAHGGARLVLIVGASGSGKSSVLKAGALPYLSRDRRRFLPLPPFRPGRTPLLAFAKVLAEALGRPAEFQAIRAELSAEDPGAALASAVEALTIGSAREATVLISIDQFEELFTIAGGEEREAFLRLLTAAAATNEEHPLPILVVATVRSDLLGEILKAEGFTVAHEVFTLGALPTDRLPSVIEGPAQIAAIHLEDGLVARILQDVGSAPEALPLLAFTLRELHQRYGADKKLTLLEYEELGDRERNLSPLENAVRRTAEEELAALAPSSEELAALMEAFVGQLVRVNEEGIRLRRPARLEDIPQASQRLVNRLIAARLLSIRSEGDANAVEVAHEALFKAWPQLAGWLDEEQDFLIGRRQIEDAERLWVTTPEAQKEKALLSGLLLEKAREWSVTHPERLKSVRDYVLASIRRADAEWSRAQRRQRMLTIASVGAAAVFLALSILALFQWNRAEQQTQRAEEQTRRAVLARHAADATAPPQRNLLLGVELARLRTEDSSGAPLAAIDTVRQQLRLVGGLPLPGHLKSTRVAAFSHSGRWLATGSDDGMVRLWDVGGLQPNGTVLSKSGSKIRTLAFSSDDKWLFSGDDAGAIRSWTVGNAAITHSISNRGFGAVNALSSDPKGRWLAFGTKDGKVCVWKLTKEELAETPCWNYGREVVHLQFSGKGRWLAAAGGYDSAPIALWDLSGESLPPAPKRFQPKERLNSEPWLTAVAFSGDETRLAVAYSYHSEVWDLTNEEPPLHVLGRGSHRQWITGVAVSPDGRWLATAGSDSRVKLWEIGGPPEPVLLEGHSASVNSVAFSDDGKWLVTASHDAMARLWDLSLQRTVPSLVLRGQDLPISRAIFSPGAPPRHVVTVGDDQHARLWTIANRTADPAALKGHSGAITAAALSADGKWIASSGIEDRQLLIRSVERPHAPARMLSLGAFAKGVAFSRDGRWLAAVLDGNTTLYLWRFPELGTAFELSMGGTPGDVSLGFSPDSRWLVVGTWNTARVNLWDVSGDRPSATANHHCSQRAGVRGIAFTADGRYALTGAHWRRGAITQARVWDLRAPNPCAAPRILDHDREAIARVAISNDGRWAATAGDHDRKARLWDLSGKEPKRMVEKTLGDRVTATAFSADGRWVAFGDWGGGIAVIDLHSREALTPIMFSGHFGRTNSVAFTPDSGLLITSGEDQVTRLWDPTDLRESPVGLRGHEGTVIVIGVSPENRRLATYDDNGTILLWQIQLHDLIALACRTAGRQLTKDEVRDFLGASSSARACSDQPELSK